MLNNLSIKEVSERTELDFEQIKTAIEWLVNHQVIKQDTRSINAGHSGIEGEEFYYTVPQKMEESW